MKEFEQAAMQVFSKLPEEYPLPPQPVELTGLSLDGLCARWNAFLPGRRRKKSRGAYSAPSPATGSPSSSACSTSPRG